MLYNDIINYNIPISDSKKTIDRQPDSFLFRVYGTATFPHLKFEFITK